MEKKKRNILLLCAAILLGSYIARSVVISYLRMVHYQQQTLRQRQIAKPKPTPSDAPKASPSEAPVPNLSGIWNGHGVVKARGVCSLRLELKQNDPVNYSSYSTFSCIATDPLINPKDANMMSTYLKNLNPDSAILTGTVGNGAIHFHADKTIGTDINGCAITELTLTPFGASQIVAEWQEGTCLGGNLMMQRGQMKTIWAIVGGLLGVLILSFTMVIVMVTNPPAPHKTIPPPCACKGRCMRKEARYESAPRP